MSTSQPSNEALVEEYLKNNEEEERRLADAQPQPFSQTVLVQYFVEEFNSTHTFPMPEEELELHKMEVINNIKRVLRMTLGEVRRFFNSIDDDKRNTALIHNDQVVFDHCLTAEITKLGLSGKERDKFRAEREAAYITGEFDYPAGEKQAQEILIRMQDIHFPEGSKKLMEVETTSTFDKLLEKEKEVQQKVKK